MNYPLRKNSLTEKLTDIISFEKLFFTIMVFCYGNKLDQTQRQDPKIRTED